MPLFAGRILLRADAPEGWLSVEGGRIVATGLGEPPTEVPVQARGWIVPAPVNAHTHVADAFLRDRPGKPRSVAQLVGPGGWKQRHLAAARPDEVAVGIEAYAGEMAALGTQAFLDFREGGVAGAATLRALAPTLPVAARVYGRPQRNDYQEAEAMRLLDMVDGVGLSALRDFERPRDVQAWADACHDGRKPFALHASEAVHEPLEDVLALEPAFLVHGTQAKPSELEEAAQGRVPVVVCPRSNAHYGLRTPIEAMLEAGVRVAVGTDNGMLQDGNLFLELAQLSQWAPGLDEAALLRLATWNARPLAGLATEPPKAGQPADWVVLPASPLAGPPARKPSLGLAAPPAGRQTGGEPA